MVGRVNLESDLDRVSGKGDVDGVAGWLVCEMLADGAWGIVQYGLPEEGDDGEVDCRWRTVGGCFDGTSALVAKERREDCWGVEGEVALQEQPELNLVKLA
eukprot:CAMPEP_0174752676 /NCGR_PEP_ID=MMETSP1094-20130205/102541_1 /TAXON_ID=156173 /ORGANISM="Chrysochromulina brevifilum, Strain UTEX LB 985" /LENGTH=100 /DNA_ID=CAMNT_0015958349 /DNA_START=332 /DNA_END=634 /DNA_ORIENTATION=+